jgi:CelD/BcsL family acetyltransferase involved in cellulose biosynthesis
MGSADPVTNRLELEPLGGMDEVRAEWSALARASRNPFLTPEWCELWLAHIGADCRLHLFGGRRDGETLAAIVPLVVTRGRYIRKARFLGFGPAQELGPIADPADREAAAELLRQALAAIRREWDVFLGDHLPGGGWKTRVGGTLVARKGSPAVRGPWESWDGYLASRSSNFRQELRRKERRLGDRGLHYREVSELSELDRALDVLFELHRARWGEDASIWFAGQEAFQRAFSRTALEHGWLRLRLLELNGRPAAAYHGFRFGEAEWSYQFGRDPSEKSSSVGLVITAHALRRSLEEGAAEFKLGPGAQLHKLRFATEDAGLETVGLARGLRGRAAILAAKKRGR